MNWKLIGLLSLFGLAMALGTVSFIPSNVEPMLWLPIFLITAWVIATRAPRRVFLHGLLLGLANCVWITAAHILLLERYLGAHPREAAMIEATAMPGSPRLMMAVI